MRVYNTLTRQTEELVPIDEKKIRMYACGVTVYDELHIGHARQAIVFDVLRRYLEFLGYEVTYVRNYTDVDDKIIRRANELGQTCHDLTSHYIAEGLRDLHRLKVEPATFEPRVTDHIRDIVAFVDLLVAKGYAYVQNGEVIFDVGKCAGYGKLSHQRPDELINTEDTPNKRTPQDFVLWKPAKPGEPSWVSPWGEGRPGWHIECSVMANKYLGNPLDIHGGGVDLVFPHHENEIAQSEAGNAQPFAHYWIHNGLVTVDGRKMSKTLGNFITVKQALQQHHPDVVRFAILSYHYSSGIDFTEDLFRAANKRVYYSYKTLYEVGKLIERHDVLAGNLVRVDFVDGLVSAFRRGMDDNFNTARVLADLSQVFAQVNQFISGPSADADKAATMRAFQAELAKITGVLRILDEEPAIYLDQCRADFLAAHQLSREAIGERLQKRGDARRRGDFVAADGIRDELRRMGIAVLDTPHGAEWDILIE